MTNHKTKKSNNDDYKVAIIAALVALLLMMGHASRSQQFSQNVKGIVEDYDSRETLLGSTVQIIKTEKL